MHMCSYVCTYLVCVCAYGVCVHVHMFVCIGGKSVYGVDGWYVYGWCECVWCVTACMGACACVCE